MKANFIIINTKGAEERIYTWIVTPIGVENLDVVAYNSKGEAVYKDKGVSWKFLEKKLENEGEVISVVNHCYS